MDKSRRTSVHLRTIVRQHLGISASKKVCIRENHHPPYHLWHPCPEKVFNHSKLEGEPVASPFKLHYLFESFVCDFVLAVISREEGDRLGASFNSRVTELKSCNH